MLISRVVDIFTGAISAARVYEWEVLLDDWVLAFFGFELVRLVFKKAPFRNVLGDAHTNGIESMCVLFKRGYHGICHNDFTGRYNFRKLDTLDQMLAAASALDGRHLPYKHLTDDHPNEPMIAQRPLLG